MSESSESPESTDSTESPEEGPRIVVIGPDGMATSDGPVGPRGSGGRARGRAGGEGGEGAEDEETVTGMVAQPAKVMRIGSMIKQLLEEVRNAPLDEASRARLREIHASSIKELEEGLSPDLVEELDRLTLPFSHDSIPSESELRVAQAQLVGWLEGLFHGIQTALFAQQMAARAQLEEMRRRALPPGMGGAAPTSPASDRGHGNYL